MIPWWGTLIACTLFGFWSVICFLIGAAIKGLAMEKKPAARLRGLDRNVE